MPTTLETRPENHSTPPHGEANPLAPSTVPEDIIRQASDPTTPPEILVSLAAAHGDTVGERIAANPNTLTLLLHQLWQVHPLAALENPILAYRALSTGKPFHELLPESVKLALYDALRKESRSEDLENYLPEHDRRNWLRYSRDEGSLAELSPALADSVFRHLASDPSPDVRRTLLDRVRLKHLHFFTSDPDESIRLALAEKLPRGYSYESNHVARWDAVTETLSRDPDERVRASVASSSCLTANTHMTLASDPSSLVRNSLAESGSGPDLPQAGWRKLISGGDVLCRLVAQNTNCPASVRLDLSSHSNSEVRTMAWGNLHFADCQLKDKLAGKLDIVFSDSALEPERLTIAGNQTITPAVIPRLLQCEASVTRVLAKNPNLQEEDRAALLQSDDPETAAIAVRHSFSAKLLNQGFSHSNPKVRAALAGMTGQHATTLRLELAVDPSAEVREAVRKYLMDKLSGYDGCNIRETLRILSHDPLAKIRAALVWDRRLPMSELTRLGDDPSVQVRIQVLKRLSLCPPSDFGLLDHESVRVRLIAANLILPAGWGHCGWHSNPRAAFDAKIASDSSPKIRSVAAECSLTSVVVLSKLIRDEDPGVQKALANQSLPCSRYGQEAWVGQSTPRVLSCLERHRNPYCRAVAASSRIAGKKRQARMAFDRCWFVRLMLAKNGHELDEKIIQRLARDAHQLVRQQVETRFRYRLAKASRLTKGGRP
jgi:hypothetical protein